MKKLEESNTQRAAGAHQRLVRRWDEIPLSSKAREKMIYGEDIPLKLTWEERLQRAKRIAKLSPWGLELRTYQSPYYALIGGLEARRKMAGGLWKLKHWGDELSSESLEELFLQVVERLDDAARPNAVNPVVYSAFGNQKRDSRGSWDEDWLPESIRYTPGTRWGYLPSEGFYSTNH